jgi:hypothetical protein
VTAERNEAIYQEATNHLSIHDQHMFAHRMIGALSSVVSEEDWAKAVKEVIIVGALLK